MNYVIAVMSGILVSVFWFGSVSAESIWTMDTDEPTEISEKKFEQKIGSLSMIDLGKDGLKEFVIGSPVGTKSTVSIVRQDGSVLFSFHPYTDRQSEGANVAVGDLDGDAKPEIVAIPALGRSQVKIFDTYGKPKLAKQFYAFDRNQVAEHQVALANVSGGAGMEIAVFTGRGLMPSIKVFSGQGKAIAFKPDLKGFGITGLRVANLRHAGEKYDDFLIAEHFGIERKIMYVDAKGKTIRTIPVDDIEGVLDIAVDASAGKGEPNVVVLASGVDNPSITRMDETGARYSTIALDMLQDRKTTFHAVIHSLKGEIFPKLLVIPSRIPNLQASSKKQTITISLRDQRLRFFDRGFETAFVPVSTGRPSSPTPTGTFAIANHFARPYSRKANLYMPFWMAFKVPEYGLHELPEWSNGAKEGAEHLGLRVSHGCVRLPVGAAKAIWSTAKDGAVVEIL